MLPEPLARVRQYILDDCRRVCRAAPLSGGAPQHACQFPARGCHDRQQPALSSTPKAGRKKILTAIKVRSSKVIMSAIANYQYV